MVGTTKIRLLNFFLFVKHNWISSKWENCFHKTLSNSWSTKTVPQEFGVKRYLIYTQFSCLHDHSSKVESNLSWSYPLLHVHHQLMALRHNILLQILPTYGFCYQGITYTRESFVLCSEPCICTLFKTLNTYGMQMEWNSINHWTARNGNGTLNFLCPQTVHVHANEGAIIFIFNIMEDKLFGSR